MRIKDCEQKPSPTRLLEMLSDRFGAFEAIANSSIKLARVALGFDPSCQAGWGPPGESLCKLTVLW